MQSADRSMDTGEEARVEKAAGARRGDQVLKEGTKDDHLLRRGVKDGKKDGIAEKRKWPAYKSYHLLWLLSMVIYLSWKRANYVPSRVIKQSTRSALTDE